MAEKETAPLSAQGLIEGLAAIDDKKPYLGDSSVVDLLVRVFIADLLQCETPDACAVMCGEFALVFAGETEGYSPIPNWSSRNELGALVCRRYGVDPDQTMQEILRTMFLKVAGEVFDVVRQNQDSAPEEWSWQIDGIVEFVVSVLIGTADSTHPADPAES